jgi:hypothetical protein
MNFAQVKTIVDKDEKEIKDTTLNQEQKLAQSENLGKALLSQLKKEEGPQHKTTTKKKATKKQTAKKDDKKTEKKDDKTSKNKR